MNKRAIDHSLGFSATGGIRIAPPVKVFSRPLEEGRVLLVSAPIHVVSEANRREHHMAKARRVKAQRSAAAMVCRTSFGAPPGPPLLIRLTRFAPRKLDSDNLAGAFKAIRDGIADWLGINDGDERLRWDYAQAPADPKVYAIRIELSRLTEALC